MRWVLKTGFRQQYLDLWLLLLRVLVAAFMLTHGLPKFYRLMEGGEIQFPDPIGLGSVTSLVLTVFAELICSTFVFIGFATRLAAVPLIINLSVAAFIVHANDPFAKKELALLYLCAFVTLLIAGSGRYSVDFLLRKKD